MSGSRESSHPRIAKIVVLGVLAVAGLSLALLPIRAQTPDSLPPLVIRPPQGIEDSTLFLMLRTKPNLDAEKIRARMTEGLEKARCTFRPPVEVKPISSVVFDEMSRLVGRGALADASQKGGVEIYPISNRGNLVEVRTPKATQSIKSLTVEYKKFGKKTYTKDGKDDERLDMLYIGSYVFNMLANDEPVKYTAELTELGEEAKTVTTDWPILDRFFVVTVRGFRGDQQVLFDTLKNPALFPNAWKSIEPMRNYAFAFANVYSEAATVGDKLLEGNNYVPAIAGIPGETTSHVWMLFPLTPDEAATKKAELRKLTQAQLLDVIGKNAVTAVDSIPEVGPTSPSKWYQLVDRGKQNSFTRQIPLKDFRGLTEKYTKVHRLIVYAFDPTKFIEVKDPANKTVDTFVIEEEIVALPALFRQRGQTDSVPEKK